VKSDPETIENRRDILYRDYAEIYDAFTSFPYHPRWVDVVNREFPLAGKVVVDTGSGTGKSTFALAEYAQRVIGVEPEPAMRALAEQALAEQPLDNVEFVAGSAEAIPLPDESVDMATAITASTDIDEALRVLKPGGLILRLDIATDWYGGELNQIINDPTPELTEGNRRLVEELGFSSKEFDSIQEYGSTDNIVRTFGFIFGRNAIEHLKATGKTSIRWRFRIHYRHNERPARNAAAREGDHPVRAT
jgi:ubiquinone/menaquinone biosynthesis C-methylase UbiE